MRQMSFTRRSGTNAPMFLLFMVEALGTNCRNPESASGAARFMMKSAVFAELLVDEARS